MAWFKTRQVMCAQMETSLIGKKKAAAKKKAAPAEKA